MAEKTITKKDILKRLDDMNDLLFGCEDQGSINEAVKIFTDMGGKIKEFHDFSRGKGSLQEWVEINRMIYGRKFSYTDARIDMLLGQKDKKIMEAPRPYLIQYINDRTKDKTTIKCRQCLPEETIINVVNDSKIIFRRLGDLYKEKYKGEILYNENGINKISNVIDIWKSGIKEMLRIRTKSGKTIDCSLKEKIWNEKKKKFVLANKLKKGDFLKLYEDGFGSYNNETLAISFGYWFCDGTSFYNKHKKKIAFFTNTNYKYIHEFYNNFKKERRVYPKKIDNKKRRYDVFLRDKDELKIKMREWGIFGKNKDVRFIPEEMMRQNKKCTSLMINRMFSADGWYTYKTHHKYKSFRGGIGLASMSLEFLTQLQILLYRYKIKSIIKKEKSEKRNLITGRIIISGIESIYKFAVEIGIYDKINKRDINLLKKHLDSKNKFSKRHEQYENFCDNQIVMIKRIKDRNTFDLSIKNKKYHNFYANNILVSNSEFTESEINENIYLCSTRPYTNVRHIFPTAGVANKMAKEKISIAIEKSPRIVKLLKKPFNSTSKNFLNGSFYTVDSSYTDHQGRGPSSDKLTFDEYESQNPQVEDIYSESTSHSELGKKVRISTPKFPDSGIDEKYKKGCQYEWIIICHKCKKEQIMEFPDNIINFFDADTDIDSENYLKKLDKVYIGCKYCKAYLNRVSPFYLKNSRWVSMKPHMIPLRASYRVTYFMLPWKTGKEILYKYHTFKFEHQFWNEIAGYAYISPQAKLDKSVFERCQDRAFVNEFKHIGMARHVSIGVDWGEVSWVVVRADGFPPDLKKPRIIYAERIDFELLEKTGLPIRQTAHSKRVEQIAIFFNAKIIVNDANGIGTDRNTYLISKFPNKAWGCYYDTAENQRQKKKKNILLIPQWNKSARRVTVSRLNTFRELVREYEEKNIDIPRLDTNIEEFIKHHGNIVIERYWDEKNDAIFEVVGKTGPDHYAHADNYAKIGYDKIKNTYTTKPSGVIAGGQSAIDSQLPPPDIDNIHPLL